MYPCGRLFHAYTFRHFIGFLTFSCVAGQSIKRSLATRLAFDETMEEPQSTRKISKLDSDFSFQAGAGSGLRRFTSENIDSVSKLQRDHQELRARTKQMEAELAGERAKVASTESRARNLELERERDRAAQLPVRADRRVRRVPEPQIELFHLPDYDPQDVSEPPDTSDTWYDYLELPLPAEASDWTKPPLDSITPQLVLELYA